jgi:hypothetical protein
MREIKANEKLLLLAISKACIVIAREQENYHYQSAFVEVLLSHAA